MELQNDRNERCVHRLGLFILLPAVTLLLLGSSFKVVLFPARIGAWIGTLGRADD
jgi:hypothetical protein